MADPRMFLHARIGRTDEWVVRAQLVAGTLPGGTVDGGIGSLRRWVALEEHRGDLYARLGDAQLQLTFTRRSEQRRVRRELASWSRPFVSLIELTSDGRGELEGTLVVMRTALPAELAAAPSIVLEPSLLAALDETDRPRLSDLADEVVLPSGDGMVMVVTTPMLVGAASTGGAARVLVHLHRRWHLDCDLVGDPGAQHLHVREIKEGNSPIIRDGRFIRLLIPPRFVAAASEAKSTDLTALSPRRHEVIEAWIAYEELAQDQRVRSFDERRRHPLEYSEVAEAPGGADPTFRVVLAAPQDARDHWIDPRAGRKKRVKVKAAVEVADLDGKEEALRGEVVAFEDRGSGRLDAIIKLQGRGRVPPVRGRLLAIEDKGEMRQRERRKAALDRLRFGTSANPELLGWLMNPRTVPDADVGPRAGLSLVSLDEHQRRAVAMAVRASSLVLILGPPGTGKTTVIRAIVDELRKRAGLGRAGGEEPRPFRVLVTSIQNEAVANVVEKVGGTAGIEVWHMGDRATGEARAQRLGRDAERIAAELWTELRDTPRFISYERLHRLRDAIALLRHAIYEVDVGRELAERLRALTSTDERLALTPLLGEQLGQLVVRLDRALAAAVPGPPPVSPSNPSALAMSLARLADVASELNPDTWPALAPALDAVAACLDAPAAADGPFTELGERWADVRRRLRREPRVGFSAEAVQSFDTLRRETANVLGAVAARTPAPVDSTGVDPDLVAAVHAWLQRATALVESELAARSVEEEAVLYHWLQTLAREPVELSRIVERHALVTAATCQQVDQQKHGAPPAEYDVVIVDEAARAGIDVLVPITLARSIILVGDHRQLPPHVDRDLAEQIEEGLREQVDIERESLFSWLWERLPPGNVVCLSRQYRMHEDIGTAVSRLFYEVHEPKIVLSHHFSGEREAERRPRFGLCNDEPLVWLDTRDVLQDPAARAEARIESWPCGEHNEYEVQLVARLLRRADRGVLREALARDGKKPIGLIAFYNEQVERLRRLVEEELDPELADLVQLGSVDSFQGREFPLVILSTVRSNRDGAVGFLRLPNRINVAMSRAQRQMILLGDSATLAAGQDRGSPELGMLYRDLRSKRLRGIVLDSAELVR